MNEAKVTVIEFTCVGNAGKGYINAQIQVSWFEVAAVDHENRIVDVVQHHIPIKAHRREHRINFCEFDIPDDTVCFVRRHIQTNPNIEEHTFFKVQKGHFHALAEGWPADFAKLFMQDFNEYRIRFVG